MKMGRLTNKNFDCLNVLVDYFNIILDTWLQLNGAWALFILHIKMAVSDPDNYRGITLHSCASILCIHV